MSADIPLILLTLPFPTAPKALEQLKAKVKGLFSKKKEEKKPEETTKPTETTTPATTTEAPAPAPATAPASKLELSGTLCDSTHAYLIDADDTFLSS